MDNEIASVILMLVKDAVLTFKLKLSFVSGDGDYIELTTEDKDILVRVSAETNTYRVFANVYMGGDGISREIREPDDLMVIFDLINHVHIKRKSPVSLNIEQNAFMAQMAAAVARDIFINKTVPTPNDIDLLAKTCDNKLVLDYLEKVLDYPSYVIPNADISIVNNKLVIDVRVERDNIHLCTFLEQHKGEYDLWLSQS